MNLITCQRGAGRRGFSILLWAMLCAAMLAHAEPSPTGIDRIPVCMNFGCKTRQIVSITPEEWNSVADWFKPVATDPESERQKIKNAVGWMEVIVGRHTPTYRDVGGDRLGEPQTVFPGQLDCIDESINTTTYLKLFQDNGLLKFYRVSERAYRRALLDQHWAGQIESIDSGERWVVDSWFQDNGYLPYLQESSKWVDIGLFTSVLDNSQAQQDQSGSFFARLFKARE